MKILITTDLYKPFINGVVTSVDSLVSQLIKKGHSVKIITLSNSHHSYTIDNIIYLGSIDFNKIYPGAKLNISFMSKELKAVYEWKPDIVHSQCEFSTFHIAKKIAKKLNIPLIHTYHTIYEDYTHYFSPNEKIGHYMASKFSAHILNQCDEVIAPTTKVENLLKSYDVIPEISVIPSGINLSAFLEPKDENTINQIKNSLKIKEGNFIIGFVGRIAKEKNLDELFEIFKNIPEENITLMIVGNGPYKEELMEKSKSIDKQIIFTSMINPSLIHHYYKCFDLFMSCSSSETQGLTYIEALASGVPILCKKDSCLDDVLINSVNGWDFEDQAQANALFSKYFKDEENRKKMSINAQNLAKVKFSSSSFCNRVLELYDSAININQAISNLKYMAI